MQCLWRAPQQAALECGSCWGGIDSTWPAVSAGMCDTGQWLRRLSKRLTAELSGAHAMITRAIADQGSATEALRTEIASRMHEEGGAALVLRQDLQASLDRLATDIEKVRCPGSQPRTFRQGRCCDVWLRLVPGFRFGCRARVREFSKHRRAIVCSAFSTGAHQPRSVCCDSGAARGVECCAGAAGGGGPRDAGGGAAGRDAGGDCSCAGRGGAADRAGRRSLPGAAPVSKMLQLTQPARSTQAQGTQARGVCAATAREAQGPGVWGCRRCVVVGSQAGAICQSTGHMLGHALSWL